MKLKSTYYICKVKRLI